MTPSHDITPHTHSERIAVKMLEELMLLRGELSGLRGDLKALKDFLASHVGAPERPAGNTPPSSLSSKAAASSASAPGAPSNPSKRR